MKLTKNSCERTKGKVDDLFMNGFSFGCGRVNLVVICAWDYLDLEKMCNLPRVKLLLCWYPSPWSLSEFYDCGIVTVFSQRRAASLGFDSIIVQDKLNSALLQCTRYYGNEADVFNNYFSINLCLAIKTN